MSLTMKYKLLVMEHKAFYALAPSHLLRTKLSLLSLFFLPSFCILGSMGILKFPEQLGYFSLFSNHC